MSSIKTTLPLVAMAAARLAMAASCDCYLIDGEYPAYILVPPVLDSIDANKNADFSSSYFNWESEFAQFWGPQNWDNGAEDFVNVNSYNNLYIEKSGDSTFMTMRTARLPKFQTSAEFESIYILDHASIRMYSRTIGSHGACTAVFTYREANSLKDVQESDIEILTSDPKTSIRYPNQPTYLEDGTIIDGASNNICLRPLERMVHAETGVDSWPYHLAPKDPSKVNFNAWSDGGDWTGKMPEGGVAYQQIQWIEMLYNVVDKASCTSVCSIDADGAKPGFPVKV
ncbi:unnamed protein product [Clonostachys chloroleuca]|uniref:Uncharacterized protein n=1 Tax=Clonostachys chloroleuca TaxID=1926264 RepID=A0AA35M5V3_9HYPO|nr:unnamed protein product [Clonostachys chloroleuca]